MMQKLYKGKDVCFCDSFYVPNFLKTGWSLSQEAQEPEAQEPEAQEPEAQEPKKRKGNRPPKQH